LCGFGAGTEAGRRYTYLGWGPGVEGGTEERRALPVQSICCKYPQCPEHVLHNLAQAAGPPGLPHVGPQQFTRCPLVTCCRAMVHDGPRRPSLSPAERARRAPHGRSFARAGQHCSNAGGPRRVPLVPPSRAGSFPLRCYGPRFQGLPGCLDRGRGKVYPSPGFAASAQAWLFCLYD